MKLVNGEWIYQKYGSVNGYYCAHCARLLTKQAKEPIYNPPNVYYFDGAGRVRCDRCKNMAEWV